MGRFFFFLVLIGVSSCTHQLSPFTSGLVENQGWSEQDLRKIQYYLSDDVQLERQIRQSASDIVFGEIIIFLKVGGMTRGTHGVPVLTIACPV